MPTFKKFNTPDIGNVFGGRTGVPRAAPATRSIELLSSNVTGSGLEAVANWGVKIGEGSVPGVLRVATNAMSVEFGGVRCVNVGGVWEIPLRFTEQHVSSLIIRGTSARPTLSWRPR